MTNASIGCIGRPYFDETNDRTKAFVITVHSNITDVKKTLEAVLRESKGSRLSVRILADNHVTSEELRNLSVRYNGFLATCEALVAVNKQGCHIAYFGWNQDSRITSLTHRQEEQRLFDKVCSRTKGREHDYSSFTVETNGQYTVQDIDRLLQIYRATFSSYLVEFTPKLIWEMLSANHVSVVRHDGQIVAVAMGEVAQIELGEKTFRLCEISEVATHPDFQKRGLSHLAFNNLLCKLVEENIEVIFSETRAASYGMMAVAKDAGLVPCGRLEQHCIISSPFSDVGQDGEYGDLVVFALPPRG